MIAVFDLDVDEVTVDRAVQGDRTIPLTADEMWVAWQTLEQQGHGARHIGRILGVAPRSVVRWRAGTVAPSARRPPRESRHHCLHGHRLTPDNVYVDPRTRTRNCRECLRRNSRAWKRRNRAAQLELAA